MFLIKNRNELWRGTRYLGTFSKIEDMLEYVWREARGEFLPEEITQLSLEWD